MLPQAYVEARRLISGVRPPILDESGLVAALAHLVHDQGTSGGPFIESQSEMQRERLPLVLENTIYRMTQEALTNACRYSRSDAIKVSLVQDQDSEWLWLPTNRASHNVVSVGSFRIVSAVLAGETRIK